MRHWPQKFPSQTHYIWCPPCRTCHPPAPLLPDGTRRDTPSAFRCGNRREHQIYQRKTNLNKSEYPCGFDAHDRISPKNPKVTARDFESRHRHHRTGGDSVRKGAAAILDLEILQQSQRIVFQEASILQNSFNKTINSDSDRRGNAINLTHSAANTYEHDPK